MAFYSGYKKLFKRNFKYICSCITIPIILLTIIIHGMNIASQKREFEQSNIQTANMLTAEFENLWRKSTQIALNLLSNPNVSAFCNNNRDSYSYSMLRQFERITDTISTLKLANSEFQEIVISMNNPEYYIYSGGGISPISKNTISSYTQKPLLLATELNNAESGDVWFYRYTSIYCYMHTTIDGNYASALLSINLNALYERIGNLLDDSHAFQLLANGQELMRVGDAQNARPTQGIQYISGQFVHTLQSDMPSSGWTLLFKSNESRFGEAIRTAAFQCLLLSLCMIALSILLSYAIAIVVCKPYHAIATLLNQPIQDAESIYMKNYSSIDDLGIIRDMIQHTKYQLFAAQNELESREHLLKEAHFRALQAQINPHFLYNVLESINWKAYTLLGAGSNEISTMICDLSQLIRLSVENEQRLIPFREEIDHAKLYLKIQQRRFPDRFQVTWRIPSDCLDILVVPLTLQPLLENAISHGVKKMRHMGHILVACEAREQTIFISVTDDGPGFSPESLAAMRKKLSSSIYHTSEHVGLFSVHQRLRLTFDEKCGVTIDSQPHIHTCVCMRFPKVYASGAAP